MYTHKLLHKCTNKHKHARLHTQYVKASALLAAIYKNGHIQWVCNTVRLNKISVLFSDLIVLVIFNVPQHKAASIIQSAQS